MTDKELRELQDRFIEALEEDGFHERVKDGMTVSLFEPGSPSIIALQRDLFPSYATKLHQHLELLDGSRGTSNQCRSRPAYFQHHGKNQPDQEGTGEVGSLGASVYPVQQRDSTGQAGQEVSVVPVKRLVKRVIRQGE